MIWLNNYLPLFNMYICFSIYAKKNNLAAKIAARNGKKMIFGKNCQLTLETFQVKIFTEIALYLTVSKINVILHFVQNFKMAARTGGENNFWKEMPDDCR